MQSKISGRKSGRRLARRRREPAIAEEEPAKYGGLEAKSSREPRHACLCSKQRRILSPTSVRTGRFVCRRPHQLATAPASRPHRAKAQRLPDAVLPAPLNATATVRFHAKKHRNRLIDRQVPDPVVPGTPRGQRSHRKRQIRRHLAPQIDKERAVKIALRAGSVKVHLKSGYPRLSGGMEQKLQRFLANFRGKSRARLSFDPDHCDPRSPRRKSNQLHPRRVVHLVRAD